MPYVIYQDLATAMNASRARWTTTLGHGKDPQNTTEYLNPWFVGLDGRTALDITYNPASIPAMGVVQTLDPVNWPPPPTTPPPPPAGP